MKTLLVIIFLSLERLVSLEFPHPTQRLVSLEFPHPTQSMGDDEACNTSLALGIGTGDYAPRREPKKDKRIIRLDLSLPLRVEEDEAIDVDSKTEGSTSMTACEDEKQASKRSSSNVNKEDDNDINNCARKKLRLTKDQSTMLEESFKRHTTLNTVQKHALADKLNLKPRQVEVWFQNRRARTKLKQTEADCEFLRKCCESLSKENRRLKKELQELRSLKQPATMFCSTFSGCGSNNASVQEKRET